MFSHQEGCNDLRELQAQPQQGVHLAAECETGMGVHHLHSEK